MPHYFFHIHIEDGGSEIDDVGAEFASEAEAITEARNLARELMAESIQAGSKLAQVVEVTDVGGRSLIRLDGQAEIKETRP